ncbi:MAG: 1-aminocyclopropane-1-carboxylate deaminase/D-cysteine desulfhydrase [Gemmataceae bacterium]
MSDAVLTTYELRKCVAKLPRLELAYLPTPLEEAPNFAAQVGWGRIFVKRDDCTGLFLGGNKTRHNEFLMADALAQGCDVVVWGAGTQSNNCRQTAAACAKLGLECHLILTRAAHNDDIQGNLLLDYLAGARVEIVDAAMGPELDDLITARAEELRKEGRKVYSWDRHKGRPLAAVSYVVTLIEIVEQMAQRQIEPAAVYCCSAGATGAGLALAKKVLGLKWKLKLIAPIKWPWDMRADVATVSNQTAELLGLPHRLTADDIDGSEDYIGKGYGLVSAEGQEALTLMARREGILLDPVYTAKAMAAMMDDVRTKREPAGEVGGFIHTGGVPAVFA